MTNRNLLLSSRLLPLLPLLPLLAAAGAQAQTTIDHAMALAGNVTPGDTPGYPVTISVPGSYVLTGNLQVGANELRGIDIMAENVTLDLNGFTVMSTTQCQPLGGSVACPGGVATPSEAADRVGIRVWKSNVVVRNGAVMGFKGHGIYSNQSATWLDGLRVWSNGHDGIRLQSGSTGSRITNSVVSVNNLNGIFAVRALIDATVVRGNGQYGFHLVGGSLGASAASYNGFGGLLSVSEPTLVRGSQFFNNNGPEVSSPAGMVRSGGGNLSDGFVF